MPRWRTNTLSPIPGNGVPFVAKFNCSTATGIEEKKVEDLFPLIFPNPSNGVYHLHVKEKSNVAVSNALGQEIKADTTMNGDFELDLRHLNSGLYVVTVTQNNKQQKVKVIKY